MVCVTLWPQLLLVVLILRQSAAVSDQCSELQEEISLLERDIVRITELKHKNELQAGNCDEKLRKQVLISQATSKELNKSIAVNIDLKKQLEVKEEVLKSINEKLSQLQTTIDGRTKTVDKMNHQLFEKQSQLQINIDGLTKRVDTKNHQLFEKQAQLQTNIDGLTKRVELLNEMSQLLCELPKDVCRSLLDAAKSGDVDSVKRLVKCDSNDNCTDYDNVFRYTPLIYAARNGHLEVVRVLLEGGANVDRTDVRRNTALHEAAWIGHVDICRLLLDWGAKVDHMNNKQDNPLNYAAWNGHLSVVKLLVERGADVNVKDGDGRNASEVARFKGQKVTANWLSSLRRG